MPKARFKLPVAVFLLLIEDDKVLLTRRCNTGWYDGAYDLASGHIEGNETLSEAVCREALEEIGIIIKPSDVRFAQLIHCYSPEDDSEYIHVYFRPAKWQGSPSITEPDKCDDMQWFPLNQLPFNLAPGTKNALETFGSNSIYLERGFDRSER